MVAESRLHFLEIDFLLQRSAGLHEQIAVDRGQSEQTRACVEREAFSSIGGQLPADVWRLLEQLNGVTLDGQSCRGRQAAGPGTDDDDSAHPVNLRPFHCVVPRRWRHHDTALIVVKAMMEAG